MDLTYQVLNMQNNSKLVFVCTRTEYGFAIHFTVLLNGIKISRKLHRTEKLSANLFKNYCLKLVVVHFRHVCLHQKILKIVVYFQLS